MTVVKPPSPWNAIVPRKMPLLSTVVSGPVQFFGWLTWLVCRLVGSYRRSIRPTPGSLAMIVPSLPNRPGNCW